MGSLVTVIVPVYNAENTIKQCIESILNQSYKNIEVIAVLDGENDKCRNILRKIAENDSRLVVIEKVHEGVSVARNTGVGKAKGEWIAFVDADDYVEKNYVELMLHNVIEGTDIVVSDYYACDGDIKNRDTFLDIDYYKDITKYRNNLITGCILPDGVLNTNSVTNIGVPWAKLFRRDFIVENKLEFVPGLKRMQDTIFCINALAVANKIIWINAALYCYVRNNNSVTKKYTADFSDTVKKFFDEIEKINKQHGNLINENYKDCKTIALYTEMLRLQFSHVDCKKSVVQRRNELKRVLSEEPFRSSIKRVPYTMISKRQKVIVILTRCNALFTVVVISMLKELLA